MIPGDGTTRSPSGWPVRSRRGRLTGPREDAMRLLLDAAIQDETVDALRALSTDLEIVDVRGDDGFSYASLVDDRLEVIVGSRAPADLALVPALRWLQLRSAGVDHL